MRLNSHIVTSRDLVFAHRENKTLCFESRMMLSVSSDCRLNYGFNTEMNPTKLKCYLVEVCNVAERTQHHTLTSTYWNEDVTVVFKTSF